MSAEPHAVVHEPWPFDAGPPEGTGLCLSGGGYRAMLFHVGAVVRLNELGLLRGLRRISGVSGGAITTGVLGLAWRSLDWDEHDRATNLDRLFVDPLFAMGGRSIDVRNIVLGLVTPRSSASAALARTYDSILFHGATLQDLPGEGEGPRFVIDATNVQTGKQFRFSRPYMGDWTLGIWREPTVPLAAAVAASSSAPPFFSPHRLVPTGTHDPSFEPTLPDAAAFLERVVLSDGGVYDNLGLNTVWTNCATVLVSDAGAPFRPELRQHGDWVRHFVRVADVIDSQVRALRKHQVIGGFESGARAGAYWSILSDPAHYGLADALPDPHQIAGRPAGTAADVHTRLAALSPTEREEVIGWGYAIADTALRAHVVPGTPAPAPWQRDER